MSELKQFGRRLEVPLTADSVDAPIVQYGGDMTAIHFTTKDGRWGRVTFESLDSIKISRGEYEPFPSESSKDAAYSWVTTISNSLWLQERYEYEKKHYGKAYNFGGNVNEMQTEFSHYVFSFHDQFVEALARGIWFESGDSMLRGELAADHPFRGLRHLQPSERFEEAGIKCQVRRNPLPEAELRRQARLCSQTLMEIAAELDGRVGIDWSLTLRVLDGMTKVYLRNYFGNSVNVFEEIPDLSTIRPVIDEWLSEVRERRKKMGKA